MNDFSALLAHSKRENKFDSKNQLSMLNEVAELNDCSHCIYFESRHRGEELYMWVSKTPSGPSIKFEVDALVTLDELKLFGNCMKGMRAILIFDQHFESNEQFKGIRKLLEETFASPVKHRKVKPYADHVFYFTVLDNRIWFRNYQIKTATGASSKPSGPVSLSAVETEAPLAVDGMELVEIGPRIVLNPIRMFSGSFGGQTTYINPNYVPASVARAAKVDKYSYLNRKTGAQTMAMRKESSANIPADVAETYMDEDNDFDI